MERYLLDEFENQKDFMTDVVEANIEKHRKGELSVSVVDGDGNPVVGAAVQIRQKSHEFRFGANIFMLDELESEEKNAQYKSLFAQTFNMATLPFYWDTLEPERGKARYGKDSKRVYRRPSPDLCIEFCEKHGIEPREHALAYEHFFPSWLKDGPIGEIKRCLEKRYKEISERYKDKIRTIEVTNELFWEKGTTAFYDDPDYAKWCFDLAAKYFPHNELGINEATNWAWGENGRVVDNYYAYVDALISKGVRVDAIGMQYHMFHKREERMRQKRYFDPKNLYKHMDLYARFGKPLQITEVSIPSYSWEKDDEQLQADIIKNLYKIWFSHPATSQIIYWNLVDGYAHVWDPDPEVIRASQGNMSLGENYYYGGLLRFDMTPKPAYYAISDLINKEWHTDHEGKTDADGRVGIKAFYGNYDVVVEYDGKKIDSEVRLNKKDGKILVQVKI